MKNLGVFVFLIFISSISVGQTTMSTSNVWSNAAAWDNGIPDASTNAFVNGFFITATVDVNAVCDSLELTISSLVIDPSLTLTVNGTFSPSVLGSVTNDGILIMRGNVQNIGGTKLTINGGVTTYSGLTMPGLTID